MRLAIVLALVSSLQIFQQSSVDYRGLATFEYSFISAAFPIGKFAATCALSIWNVELHDELDRCAKLLIFGAIVSTMPFFQTVFASIGRFLMGYSAGSGFVCAPAVLRIAVPQCLRPVNFLFLAAAFSAGTFLANLMFYVDAFISPVIFSAMMAAASGIGYLMLRPEEYSHLNCEDLHSEGVEEDEVVKSSHPVLFVFTLMVLNASIGVPLLQTYSTLMFTYYGFSERDSRLISIFYPILQMIPLLISFRLNITRKIMVLGGYYIAIFIQFVIILTSTYPFMPEKHIQIAMTTLLILLSISFIIPCNTGLCILFEQFDNGNIRTASKSRAVMWFLSSIGTLTFAKMLAEFGFAIAFLPYFLISVASYAVLWNVFPRKSNNIY
ncbi:unnamed protein product [Caenorhabditis bovis]|uniref:Major facilitator superfamily (MFS) profile domain-containing protein n=1 Tax=Caenorhabditis bovis TaxID=2654633 RepID=A0A8S1E7H1_9PELO|nr:unnamed protein product [Caenorhabditis bovis]